MQTHFILREAPPGAERIKTREAAIDAAVAAVETQGTEVIVYMAVALVRPQESKR